MKMEQSPTVRFLNFTVDRDFRLTMGERSLDAHNVLRLQTYTYAMEKRTFELKLSGQHWTRRLGKETSHFHAVSLLFREVSFLRIQTNERPGNTDVCPQDFEAIAASDLWQEAEREGTIYQLNNLYSSEELRERNVAELYNLFFVWGLDLLIAAETVELFWDERTEEVV